MADKQTERFLCSQQERHRDRALVSARRIQDRVANFVRDLEAGKIPSEFSLVADAVELDKRCFALEVVADVTGIYEADGT